MLDHLLCRSRLDQAKVVKVHGDRMLRGDLLLVVCRVPCAGVVGETSTEAWSVRYGSKERSQCTNWSYFISSGLDGTL